ncbi:adenylate/guanylate cyclase domain-containing protein [Bradyrhizobium jicamae]|uniref:Adenylate/guanylate cyclase domain-containing protein n=1 Tax=Bradyrhizobium jicamae TaxID=280332 RepID=A0ABS5FMY8_9BRAD|nr:adenylate/guanylate cyclase domain-containing protein [Bradyrhizobium jicamae]MBR0798134.1 adenylate/guanylate cyclase domain-containing protein [Bradyrhizobium jicamae]MBR0936540.1 adenylate/guanylate cyclase domain-containing protein [Bradyrhizobium jicamae]
MAGFWSTKNRRDTTVSGDFHHALMQEVMTTELLRIKVLIGIAAAFSVITSAIYVLAPEALVRVWHGNFKPSYIYSVIGPFILFELWVHGAISRYMKQGRDLPVIRRYIGALIETSMPTVALALHIDSMGPVAALGWVAPLVYFIFIIASTLRLDFWLSTFTGFVAASELFYMAMYYRPDGTLDPEPDLFYHAARSVVILIAGVLAGTVGMQLRRQFGASILAATARDRITNLFGQHVSPQVVERLMTEGASTESDIRRVAVMFVDFRSFTASARTRSPQEVVDRLDGAFAVLVDILDRHGGIVNKFLGDGFLALFGAPFETGDAAHHAVAAAREMLAANDRVNATSSWPLRIGIGIHIGEVVAGNIGSPRRKEYTVIGDTVNFAARLEALNKELGSQFLISSAVRDALGDDCSDAVPRGEVPVRGYDRPVAVWQLG